MYYMSTLYVEWKHEKTALYDIRYTVPFPRGTENCPPEWTKQDLHVHEIEYRITSAYQ